MNAHLLKALTVWGDDSAETESYLRRALDQELPYREECAARILLIGEEIRRHGLGESRHELRLTLEQLDRVLAADKARAFEFLNGPMEAFERIPVRTTLEAAEVLSCVVAQEMAEAGSRDAGIAYLEARMRVASDIVPPPILVLLTGQSRLLLERSVEESKDDPASTASFKSALACARRAIALGPSYKDSPEALRQIEWAESLIRGAGAASTTPAPKGMCFIATAAYGTSLAPQIVVLTQFRDDVLMRRSLGRLLVACYSRLSPPVAAIIGSSELLKSTTRRFLAPIVWCVRTFWDRA